MQKSGKIKNLKVILVREFLTQYGGAERVLDQFLKMFPKAPIYTLIYNQDKMRRFYGHRQIVASPLQRFPLAVKNYKWYLPLMAWGVEKLKIPENTDLVLSDSSAFAKGLIVPSHIPHLCYLHTPTRYLWQVRDSYVDEAPIPNIIRPFVGPVLDYLKRWDYLAAQRPTAYIANSQNVAERLYKFYDRKANNIIFPFVDLTKFQPSKKIGDYFLSLGRIEPYKKIDLIAQAAIAAKVKLKIVGTGSHYQLLKNRFAQYRNIEFLGRVEDEEIPRLYAQARALIFPGEEDAGITPLESMAAGRPVLAFGRGGALETIIPGKTGEFFLEQTTQEITDALLKYRWESYNQNIIRQQAAKFDVSIFEKKMWQAIEFIIRNKSL